MLKILRKIKEYFERFREVFYIGSTDKLPPPLSRDEEEYYITTFLFYTLLFILVLLY